MRALLVLVVLLIAVWIGLRRLEQASLYYPDRQLIATPAQAGMPYEAVRFKTADGVELSGWWIPRDSRGESAQRRMGDAVPSPIRRSAPALTLLLCHGNGGNISHRLDKTARLHRLGLNVFLFDYRGYGTSELRTPSERGTYQDAEAAYRYLTEVRHIPAHRLILHGESLGGAVAVETALHHPAAGLIMESAFTSTMDMAHQIFPWLPARWIIHNRYDTYSKIARITMPILFLHSPSDDIVPFFMGQKNFKAATAPKRFVELVGDHNEGYAGSGSIYTNALSDFARSSQ